MEYIRWVPLVSRKEQVNAAAVYEKGLVVMISGECFGGLVRVSNVTEGDRDDS
ncbi:hypothetical protein CKAH01_00397 [Colletotrichum kahawae]|uniref:Uncharacterized protein n=1 Tax=Colletotrichum kahawae TaxID=34407 RepID=A0AAD9YXI2_COLKA|nr:hypothetical protein CKAH01_00397 [Colletotrichum kahawae]